MEKTITIKIKNYSEETPELKETFKNLGLQKFDSLHFQFNNIPEGTYEVETKHIFSKQYNTTCGKRIFEKCSCLSTPLHNKLHGYYIAEGIDKIREYQKQVKTCHYCGKQYINSNLEWCNSCRDSEYLTEKDYHLLKLTNVMEKYAPASITIPVDILEDIKTKQTEARKIRAKKAIESELASLKKDIVKAQYKYDVTVHLINLDVPTDNMIYYDHTDTFCFGWRDSLSPEEKKDIQDKITEWPFESKIEYK